MAGLARHAGARLSAARVRGALLALLAGGTLLAAAPPARATMEEYSTFDVVSREQDNKNLMDHVLARMPVEWRDEWERSPQAVRTAQGCLTSSEWIMLNELKTTAPLGGRARLDVHLLQDESDIASYESLGFRFRFPVRGGSATAEFQPSADKSRQDFLFGWEVGADTSRFQLSAVLNVEDMFNNLWAWRQTAVGKVAEPYRRRPYEPRLRMAARGDRWRGEIGGRWMTPSRKDVAFPDPSAGFHAQTLWGEIAWASVEARALGATWTAAARNEQVRTTDTAPAAPLDDQVDFRRDWSVELSARRALTRRLDGLARGIYEDRTEVYGAGFPTPGSFRAFDHLAQAELAYHAHPRLTCRLGWMRDRVVVDRQGMASVFSWGTRTKSRAYVGLTARFGRVLVQGVEGIELSREPYPVWGVHDKGFLHLQTAF